VLLDEKDYDEALKCSRPRRKPETKYAALRANPGPRSRLRGKGYGVKAGAGK